MSKEMSAEKLNNLQVIFLMNSHPDIYKTLNDSEKEHVSQLTEVYINSKDTVKRDILKMYYKEIKQDYRKRLKIVEDNEFKSLIKSDYIIDFNNV